MSLSLSELRTHKVTAKERPAVDAVIGCADAVLLIVKRAREHIKQDEPRVHADACHNHLKSESCLVDHLCQLFFALRDYGDASRHLEEQHSISLSATAISGPVQPLVAVLFDCVSEWAETNAPCGALKSLITAWRGEAVVAPLVGSVSVPPALLEKLWRVEPAPFKVERWTPGDLRARSDALLGKQSDAANGEPGKPVETSDPWKPRGSAAHQDDREEKVPSAPWECDARTAVVRSPTADLEELSEQFVPSTLPLSYSSPLWRPKEDASLTAPAKHAEPRMLQHALFDQEADTGDWNVLEHQLWQAVADDDLRLLRHVLRYGDLQKLVTARDANAHSALWHSVALGHWRLATILLDDVKGWDYLERHARRRDTLLHAFVNAYATQRVRAEAATEPVSGSLDQLESTVLHELCLRGGATLFCARNEQQATWIASAAALQLPEILLWACDSCPDAMLQLRKASPDCVAPFLNYVHLELPTVPGQRASLPEATVPQHLQEITGLLVKKPGEIAVPLADVAFEVLPVGQRLAQLSDDVSTLDSAWSQHRAARFQAHLALLYGQGSRTLVDDLMKITPQEGRRSFRVDPRISVDAFRCALQFFYTGAVVQIPRGAALIELVFACELYDLAPALASVARAAAAFDIGVAGDGRACAAAVSLLPPEHELTRLAVVTGVAGGAKVSGDVLRKMLCLCVDSYGGAASLK